MHKSLLSGISSAPLGNLLAALSAVITIAVMLSTVLNGHVPANGPLELIGALIVAALAATEASRPVKRERRQRRQDPTRAPKARPADEPPVVSAPWSDLA